MLHIFTLKFTLFSIYEACEVSEYCLKAQLFTVFNVDIVNVYLSI
jgi:hypothetical protein